MVRKNIRQNRHSFFYGRVLLLIQGGQRFSALQKPPINKPEIKDSAIIRVLIDEFVFPFLHGIYLINGELFRSVFKEVIKFKAFLDLIVIQNCKLFILRTVDLT